MSELTYINHICKLIHISTCLFICLHQHPEVAILPIKQTGGYYEQ